MDTLSLQRVKIPLDGHSEDGLLVFSGDLLVAVLACLEAAFYGSDGGRWHLEASFGRSATRQATFDTLEEALRRIADDLGLDADRAVEAALAVFRSGL